MFIHDIVKIMYINIGYLPNYPYELISDEEMFNAFTKDDGFFADYYPCPAEDMQEEYDILKDAIFSAVSMHLTDNEEIPAWVYSYMILRPITYESDEFDISYLYELTNINPPSTYAEFSPELARECLRISTEWIKKLPSRYGDRPPTMFGETHVTKSLRLDQANILVSPENV